MSGQLTKSRADGSLGMVIWHVQLWQLVMVITYSYKFLMPSFGCVHHTKDRQGCDPHAVIVRGLISLHSVRMWQEGGLGVVRG